MLTCEQIITRINELSLAFHRPPNEYNYLYFASCIHPPVKGVSYIPKHMQAEIAELPETAEVKRAAYFKSEDWSDMVLHMVLNWQKNVAVNNLFK